MKKNIYIIFLIIIFYSCKKNTETPTQPNIVNTNTTSSDSPAYGYIGIVKSQVYLLNSFCIYTQVDTFSEYI